MILLNTTGNPINREERNKINQNWQSIIGGLTSLQRQINILAGGEEVDDLLNAILDATNNANTTVDEMRTVIDEAESRLQTIITVVDRAEQLNEETASLVTQLTVLQTDLNGLKVILEDIASDEATRKANEIAREDNEAARIDSEDIRITNESSRVSAEDIRITNETNRQLAYADMMDLLNNFESVDYDPEETYDFPTLVSLNGSTYIVLQLVQGITPSDDKVNYRLVAQRGVDGTGAVSSVNSKLPDANGNVLIETGDIQNLQTVLNEKAKQSDLNTTNNNLTSLEDEFNSHLAQNASLTESGHVQLSSATNSDDETKAATPKAVKHVYDLAKGKAETVTLTGEISATWQGTSAPYTQDVIVEGIQATDSPWISVVYSSENALATEQNKSWNMVGRGVTDANKITFTCFEEKPTVAIPIQVKVVR